MTLLEEIDEELGLKVPAMKIGNLSNSYGDFESMFEDREYCDTQIFGTPNGRM